MTVSTAVDNVDHPWDVGFAGNTMIYTERAGRISAVVGGQKRLLAAPADVVNASEAGMMGLAVDPALRHQPLHLRLPRLHARAPRTTTCASCAGR